MQLIVNIAALIVEWNGHTVIML